MYAYGTDLTQLPYTDTMQKNPLYNPNQQQQQTRNTQKNNQQWGQGNWAYSQSPSPAGGSKAPDMSAWGKAQPVQPQSYGTPYGDITPEGRTRGIADNGGMPFMRPSAPQPSQSQNPYANMQPGVYGMDGRMIPGNMNTALNTANQQQAAMVQLLNQRNAPLSFFGNGLGIDMGPQTPDMQSMLKQAQQMVAGGWQNPMQRYFEEADAAQQRALRQPPQQEAIRQPSFNRNAIQDLFTQNNIQAPQGFLDQLIGLLGGNAPQPQLSAPGRLLWTAGDQYNRRDPGLQAEFHKWFNSKYPDAVFDRSANTSARLYDEFLRERGASPGGRDREPQAFPRSGQTQPARPIAPQPPAPQGLTYADYMRAGSPGLGQPQSNDFMQWDDEKGNLIQGSPDAKAAYEQWVQSQKALRAVPPDSGQQDQRGAIHTNMPDLMTDPSWRKTWSLPGRAQPVQPPSQGTPYRPAMPTDMNDPDQRSDARYDIEDWIEKRFNPGLIGSFNSVTSKWGRKNIGDKYTDAAYDGDTRGVTKSWSAKDQRREEDRAYNEYRAAQKKAMAPALARGQWSAELAEYNSAINQIAELDPIYARDSYGVRGAALDKVLGEMQAKRNRETQEGYKQQHEALVKKLAAQPRAPSPWMQQQERMANLSNRISSGATPAEMAEYSALAGPAALNYAINRAGVSYAKNIGGAMR